MAKILVIDDDRSLLRALRVGLHAEGHEVHVAVDGESGVAQTAIVAPDLVVLDMGLPDVDGLEVCRRIRQWSDVPVIVLSATGTENLKIRALDGGADDYVTKPFSLPELEARIRVAMRRRSGESEPDVSSVVVDDLHLDLVRHEATLAGERLALTSKEFEVLAFLARNVGRTCTHQMVLRAVWGPGYGSESSYVHAYVHRLRVKLRDDDGNLIRSVPGVGYVMESVAPSPER